MANFTYRDFRQKAWSGSVDLAGDTFKVLLVMANTTADSDKGAEFVDDVATLDECDATGYARVTLSGLSLSEDAVEDLYRWLVAEVDFGNLSADAARQIKGAVVLKFVTDDTDSPIVHYMDVVASGPVFPFATNGGQVKWTPSSTLGLLTI